MAYRSKMMRLIVLFTFTCLLTQSYAEDKKTDSDLTDGSEKKSINEIDTDQILQRRKYQIRANSMIQEGNAILDDSDGEVDYYEAITAFLNAEAQLKMISMSSSVVKDQIAKLQKKLGQCYVAYAQQLLDIAIDEVKLEKFKEAENNINNAVNKDPSLKPKAQAMRKLIAQKRVQAEIEYETRPEKIDPDNSRRLKKILIQSARASVFSNHRRWREARRSYESMLIDDPSDSEAIAGLQSMFIKLREAAKKRRRATEAERLADIEWKWIDTIPPEESIGAPNNNSGGGNVIDRDMTDSTSAIRKKLKSIIITKISFSNTRVSMVFKFLKNQSRISDVNGEGVNFLVILNAKKQKNSNSNPEDTKIDIGEPLTGTGLETALDPNANVTNTTDKSEEDSSQEPTISLNFDNIPLGQAITYICEQANLKYKIEEHAVIILGQNVDLDRLELRFFPVDPGMISRLSSAGAAVDPNGGGGAGGGVDFKSTFENMGVRFPRMPNGNSASISYDSGSNQLIVRNTHKQLSIMAEIIRRITVTVPQVTIEAKFVEVRQNSLEELSFKWQFLGHNGGSKLFDLSRGGGSTIGVRPVGTLVPGGADPNYWTTANGGNRGYGVRSLSDLVVDDNVPYIARNVSETFSIDTILGTNALNTLVYFLNRKDGTDILSAPKVTVQSGEEAFISMIEEHMYPESFNEPQFSNNQGGGGFTPSSPVFGEPRTDIGVVLTVTPQVAADNLSISLNIHPKVVKFIGYDRTFNSITYLDGGAALGGTDVENRYDTPIFETRELRTQVTVWDGESVVLGGTITDELTKVMDKVPLIGDLPLIGRLFRSKGETSSKKNLLMFVSARIIDPAGVPIRSHTIRGKPDFRR